MNKLIKTISPNMLAYEFLHSLNGIIGLTGREMQILAQLLDLHLASTKNKANKNSIDCAEHRKLIMDKFGVGKENLSRYFKGYREKGLILKDNMTGKTVFNPAIVPIVIGGKAVQITMILKMSNDE